MTVKEILKLAIIFLGYDDILTTSIFETGGVAASDEQNAVVDTLIRCLNLVCEEIATDYISIIDEKEVTFSDEKKLISEINSNYLETISVKNNGRNVDFCEKNSYLYANTDKATVVFKKYPTYLTLSDVCTEFAKKLPARVIAYGIAMEYSFINTLSDEASIWEKRYKDNLQILSRKNHEHRLPRWRW